MANSADYLELYFATALAGIVIVPLNIRWNIDDMVFSLEDAGAKALVYDHRFIVPGRQIAARLPLLKIIDYYPALRAAAKLQTDWPEPKPEDLVGLFYTSGTTGGPKGVMLTHRNLFAHTTFAVLEGVAPSGIYLHACPMFHLADIALLFAVTNEGGTHTFIETFDPLDFLTAVERHRVTAVVLVPTMINMVVNHSEFNRYDLSSLELLLYGASPMPLPLLELAMQKLRCKFVQAYGMTEMSPIMTLLHPEDHQLDAAQVKSAGRPMHGVEVRVVDELDHDVNIGEVGEIIGRGEVMMKGYWNRPDINREVMRGGWMHTGDMGTFDEKGYLYILDRKKDMIKTGGENVYSPEVESMVMSHPAILECAMIGIPHEKWGETIRAIVVIRPGMSLTEAELLDWCRQRLTHFKCPTSVAFLEALPKGGSGKIQKNQLRKQYMTA